MAEMAAAKPVPDDDIDAGPPTSLEIFLAEQDAAAKAKASPPATGASSSSSPGPGPKKALQESAASGAGGGGAAQSRPEGATDALPRQADQLLGGSARQAEAHGEATTRRGEGPAKIRRPGPGRRAEACWPSGCGSGPAGPQTGHLWWAGCVVLVRWGCGRDARGGWWCPGPFGRPSSTSGVHPPEADGAQPGGADPAARGRHLPGSPREQHRQAQRQAADAADLAKAKPKGPPPHLVGTEIGQPFGAQLGGQQLAPEVTTAPPARAAPARPPPEVTTPAVTPPPSSSTASSAPLGAYLVPDSPTG